MTETRGRRQKRRIPICLRKGVPPRTRRQHNLKGTRSSSTSQVRSIHDRVQPILAAEGGVQVRSPPPPRLRLRAHPRGAARFFVAPRCRSTTPITPLAHNYSCLQRHHARPAQAAQPPPHGARQHRHAVGRGGGGSTLLWPDCVRGACGRCQGSVLGRVWPYVLVAMLEALVLACLKIQMGTRYPVTVTHPWTVVGSCLSFLLVFRCARPRLRPNACAEKLGSGGGGRDG